MSDFHSDLAIVHRPEELIQKSFASYMRGKAKSEEAMAHCRADEWSEGDVAYGCGGCNPGSGFNLVSSLKLLKASSIGVFRVA